MRFVEAVDGAPPAAWMTFKVSGALSLAAVCGALGPLRVVSRMVVLGAPPFSLRGVARACKSGVPSPRLAFCHAPPTVSLHYPLSRAFCFCNLTWARDGNAAPVQTGPGQFFDPSSDHPIETHRHRIRPDVDEDVLHSCVFFFFLRFAAEPPILVHRFESIHPLGYWAPLYPIGPERLVSP